MKLSQNPMKNLYTKKKIHPSTPPPISAHLALLPVTILTLTTALSPQDKEVLAYLISCSRSSSNFSDHHRKLTTASNDDGSTIITRSLEHGKTFGCDCFKCYMSYWVLWDSSPNREVIHEIIEAYEDDLYYKKKKKKNVKEKKQKKRSRVYNMEDQDDDDAFRRVELEDKSVEEEAFSGLEKVEVCQPNDDSGDEVKVEMEKGSSIRKVFSLIGEKIWDAWSK